jgi:hypothetical protein
VMTKEGGIISPRPFCRAVGGGGYIFMSRQGGISSAARPDSQLCLLRISCGSSSAFIILVTLSNMENKGLSHQSSV